MVFALSRPKQNYEAVSTNLFVATIVNIHHPPLHSTFFQCFFTSTSMKSPGYGFKK